VILSDLAVRAVEIAAAVNRGRYAELDRPLIRALAGGLGRDLDHARRYAAARNLRLGAAVSRGPVPALVPGQAREHDPARSLARSFDAAVDLAHALAEAIDGILAPYPGLRLAWSRDHDLELARELADGAGSCLGRARALAFGLRGRPAREQVLSTGRAISRALGQALEHARALDRVCAPGLAGRLGIATAEGLAKALADGALDDFTSADLTCAGLADADLTGVRWSLTGTAWPPRDRHQGAPGPVRCSARRRPGVHAPGHDVAAELVNRLWNALRRRAPPGPARRLPPDPELGLRTQRRHHLRGRAQGRGRTRATLTATRPGKPVSPGGSGSLPF
jgi:hypothetical protein